MNPFGNSFGSSFGRKVIYVLTTTLLFSSWAAADLSCRSQSEPASHNVQHAGHGSTAIPDQDAAQSATDCPCCDDCAVLCPAMGGTALAALTTAGEQPYDSHARLTLQTVDFRPQPPPQSLFRPPIC